MKKVMILLLIGIPLLVGCEQVQPKQAQGTTSTAQGVEMPADQTEETPTNPNEEAPADEVEIPEAETERVALGDGLYATVSDEISGNVTEIGPDWIKFLRARILIFDDGGMMSSSMNAAHSDPEDWTTVFINEETVFEMAEIIDFGHGGVNRSPATFADLYLDDSIEIMGDITEDGIVAEKIIIQVFR